MDLLLFQWCFHFALSYVLWLSPWSARCFVNKRAGINEALFDDDPLVSVVDENTSFTILWYGQWHSIRVWSRVSCTVLRGTWNYRRSIYWNTTIHECTLFRIVNKIDWNFPKTRFEIPYVLLWIAGGFRVKIAIFMRTKTPYRRMLAFILYIGAYALTAHYCTRVIGTRRKFVQWYILNNLRDEHVQNARCSKPRGM